MSRRKGKGQRDRQRLEREFAEFRSEFLPIFGADAVVERIYILYRGALDNGVSPAEFRALWERSSPSWEAFGEALAARVEGR